MRRLWQVIFLAATFFGIAGCSRGPRPNILVIVVDGLRADRLDAYDSSRDLTPFLTSLAEHGNVFWNAYAQSSWASPSMASLWTSQYPSQHGVNAFNAVLSDAAPTLPKVLKHHGYATGGFSANFVLTKTMGFGQGFDHYEAFADPPKPRNMYFKARADRVNREALAWLDSVRTPAFLYVHYVEPHLPYIPPKVFFDRILSQTPDPLNDRQVVYDLFYIHRERWWQTDEKTVSALRDMYDGEVLHVDAALRQLFSDLQSRGFLDNSIVVITAENGEGFMEHGHTRHGNTLYNELLHVPLLVLVSGQTARTDIREPVSLIDIGPTLLDYLGIGAPSSFEGRSLSAGMGKRRPPTFLERLLPQRDSKVPPVYSELVQSPDTDATPPATHRHAIVLGSHKLIVHHDGSSEGYDLSADPGETNANGLSETDRRALEREIERLSRHASQSAAPTHTAPLDPATAQRLRLLGYQQ